MFCMKCGKQLPEDAQFCTGCGERISHSECENVKLDQVQDEMPVSHRVAIAVLAVGIIIVVIYLLRHSMQNIDSSDSGSNSYQNSEYSEYVDEDFEEDDTAEYFNNDTIADCLWTYMDTLLNDDYDTYLAITYQSDTQEALNNFVKSKAGYVGLNENAITIEEGTDTFFGQLTRYCIPEYNKDGSVVKDWRGERQVFGRLKVDEIDGKYYVTAHYRADPLS